MVSVRRRKGRRLPRFPQEEIETILQYAQNMPLPPQEDGDSHRERLRILRDAAFLLILADTGSWKPPVTGLLFTGMIGIPALLVLYTLFPSAYLKMPESENALISLLGMVFQVGLWEELTKIVPVIVYVFWLKRKKAPIVPQSVILVGVFSGLGFAAFENMHYAEGSLMPLLLLKLVFDRLGHPPMPLIMRPAASLIAMGVKGKFVTPRLKQQLDFIESELGQSEWFAGDELSGADVQMSFPLEAAAARGAVDDCPNILDFVARAHARPA